MWRTWLISAILWITMASTASAQFFPSPGPLPRPGGGELIAVDRTRGDFLPAVRTFPGFVGANQAGGPEELGDFSGSMTDVVYSLDDRHVAFLLTGDVSGAPFATPAARPLDSASRTTMEALKLPAVPDDQPTRTVTLRGPDLPSADRWTSFRIYDRGWCSLNVPWQLVANRLSQAFLDELNSDDRVTNARIAPGKGDKPEGFVRLIPTLRSRMPPSTVEGFLRDTRFTPADRDRITLFMLLRTDRLDNNNIKGVGCSNGRVLMGFTFELVQTDYAWVKMKTSDYAAACGATLPALEPSFSEFYSAIRSGRVPECNEMSPESLHEVDEVRFLNEFNLRDNDEKHVLLGYDEVRGQELGAHDVLARIVDFPSERPRDFRSTPQGIRVFDTDRCIDAVEDGIEGALRKAIQRKLPLGLRNALQQLLAVDPALVGEGDNEPTCDLENANSCGWNDSASSVFVGSSSLPASFSEPEFQLGGAWRGARHECRKRKPDRLPSLLPGVPGAIEDAMDRPAEEEDKPICHFQIEPDRLNVRPDGLEIVFVDQLLSDLQGTAFAGTPFSDLCGDGLRLSAAPGAYAEPDKTRGFGPTHISDPGTIGFEVRPE